VSHADLAARIDEACASAARWLAELPAWNEHIVVGGGSVASNHGPTLLSEADCVLQFARHLNAAGVPWESMHFELSRSKWLYGAPHPAADLKPSWRVDLAIVDRGALLEAQPPFGDDRFHFDAFFEFALAGNFWLHGAAYGHPKKLRKKVAADVEKVGGYLQAGLCDHAYVIVFEECDHAFPDGYADSVASTHPGVEVHVLRGW
jgi:hypothetical protein